MCTLCSRSLDVGLDGGLESLGVGAYNLCNLLAILEKKERRHGADTELLCDIGYLVYIQLVEARIGIGLGEFDDLGCNNFAGTTPGSEAVKDHKGALLFESLLEVLGLLEVVDAGLFAHLAGVCEEARSEKGLVEVCG